MSERRIVVPEGMLKAGFDSLLPIERTQPFVAYATFLEAALRWLSENPIVPTVQQTEPICELWNNNRTRADFHENYNVFIIREWAKRMFLSSEPEIPEEIADMLHLPDDNVLLSISTDAFRERLFEAFRRGQKAGSK